MKTSISNFWVFNHHLYITFEFIFEICDNYCFLDRPSLISSLLKKFQGEKQKSLPKVPHEGTVDNILQSVETEATMRHVMNRN